MALGADIGSAVQILHGTAIATCSSLSAKVDVDHRGYAGACCVPANAAATAHALQEHTTGAHTLRGNGSPRSTAIGIQNRTAVAAVATGTADGDAYTGRQNERTAAFAATAADRLNRDGIGKMPCRGHHARVADRHRAAVATLAALAADRQDRCGGSMGRTATAAHTHGNESSGPLARRADRAIVRHRHRATMATGATLAPEADNARHAAAVTATTADTGSMKCNRTRARCQKAGITLDRHADRAARATGRTVTAQAPDGTAEAPRPPPPPTDCA